MDYGIDQDVMLRELFFFHKARVLSQALGPSKTVVCDGHSVDLLPGDIILLCSDGLTDMLSDGAIEELIEDHGDDIEKASAASGRGCKPDGRQRQHIARADQSLICEVL